MGIPFAEGMRMMVDNQQRFIRAGLEVFLRIQNFPNTGDFQEVGIPVATTQDAGFTDILIDPPPQVTDVSTHNIGMSGGKLHFGARYFQISHSFVLSIREQNPSILTDKSVWNQWDNQTPVLGIIYDNTLYSIENVQSRWLSGETISWKLTCNRVDVEMDSGAQVANPTEP